MQHIVEIKYSNYKGFKKFTLSINDFNILVGPNNAGKSTIIGSLKILAEGIRKAKFKKPNYIPNPYDISIWAYEIDLQQVPVGTENVFHNYNDEEPSEITFTLNDQSSFNIFFPSRGLCYMYYSSNKIIIKNPTDFKKYISLEIGFVDNCT
jgi:AAA15 family ATPase/GTPase